MLDVRARSWIGVLCESLPQCMRLFLFFFFGACPALLSGIDDVNADDDGNVVFVICCGPPSCVNQIQARVHVPFIRLG